LTRRNFRDDGLVSENLVKERAATISVAEDNSFKYIDLNKASVTYVNAIGKTAASKYNYETDDWTHLNPWGSVVFARIVSDLLVDKYPEVKPYTKTNSTLTKLIEAGKPA
jgi:hypothetical protein